MLFLLYWNISNSRHIHSTEKIKYNNVIVFKLILLFSLLLLPFEYLLFMEYFICKKRGTHEGKIILNTKKQTITLLLA